MTQAESQATPPKRILAPTDFSAASEAGLAWARHLARRHGAALDLLHVVELMPVGVGLVPLEPETFEAFSEAGRTRLDDLVETWKADGLTVTPHVTVGRPVEAILDTSEQVEADLVVLATRGHTGLANFLLGGTASGVVRRSPVPVLTVHPDTPVPATLPSEILVPVDFSDHAMEALRQALAVVGCVAEARIVLLHAWHFYLDHEIYGRVSAELATRNREKQRQELEGRLERLAASIGLEGLRVDTELVEGRPAAAILERAGALGVDLVAMGSLGLRGKEHLVLGSVAERVVQRAPCPVLTARSG